MNDSEASDYDVIVIGGGGAGMSAAIEATKAGAHVALCEAGPRLGGSTALAGGLFYAANTPQQQALGVEDSAEAIYADVMALNGETTKPEVVRRFAEEGPATLAWLQSLGVEFPVDRLSSPDGRAAPRAHEPVGFGARIAECLEAELHRGAVDVVLKTRIEHLLTTSDGSVVGVRTSEGDVRCRAVIIATGGYGGSPEWVRRMLPKARRVGDWVWHVGNAMNRGDGLSMGEEVGAGIQGEDSALLLVTPGFYKDFEVIGPDWALMVNTRGERFLREDGAYWELAEGIEAESEPRAFYVFDRRLFEEAKPHPRVLEALAAGTITVSYVPKVFEEQLKRGRVLEAPSVAALAARIGVEAATLERTIARYNELAGRGEDADFGKAPASLKPISRAPFYAIEVRPAILVVTGGGLPIDERTRVQSKSGKPIPGLFAAGETTGNVFGRYYVGSGYAIASTMTFGRIAGREAAAFASRTAAA
ncbi:MAG: FAD-dependent oxidoreductase [Gammaproteobacteria bacterium]|nr:FAD-dependent oxidoreductase [Gammaproteobacteria bacterium]